MFESSVNVILETLSDITQNPISTTIFSILAIFVVSVIFAMFFPSWRETLVRKKILEEDERPSSLLLWIICIVILVELIKGFVIQPFIVDGASMIPTYHDKEFLLVDKLTYNFSSPKRGDVMIFKLYENKTNQYEGKYLIKRVIGLPKERIVIENGVTTIYNEDNPGGFVIEEPYVEHKDINKNIDTIIEDQDYFVMGDNRTQSYDSRSWGKLNEKDIKGRVILRVFPFSSFSYKPGEYVYTK